MVNYNEIPAGLLTSHSVATRPPQSLCSCVLLTWLWIWLPGMMHFKRQVPAPSVNSIRGKSNGTVLWPPEHVTSSVQCPTLCQPMDCSTPGLPVHHQLLEFAQTQVHWIGEAIQPSHPLSSPSPPALNLSQHQGLFRWVSSLHEVATLDQRPPLTQSPSVTAVQSTSGFFSLKLYWDWQLSSEPILWTHLGRMLISELAR